MILYKYVFLNKSADYVSFCYYYANYPKPHLVWVNHEHEQKSMNINMSMNHEYEQIVSYCYYYVNYPKPHLVWVKHELNATFLPLTTYLLNNANKTCENTTY